MKGDETEVMSGKYDDIIDLPHHESKRRPKLGVDSYAAQFSPFAALTGYDGIVSETERVTDERIELDEDAKAVISDKLAAILSQIEKEPEVTLTYFLPDKKKAGGKYVVVTGKIKKFDEYERYILTSDNTKIPTDDLYDIASDIIDV